MAGAAPPHPVTERGVNGIRLRRTISERRADGIAVAFLFRN